MLSDFAVASLCLSCHTEQMTMTSKPVSVCVCVCGCCCGKVYVCVLEIHVRANKAGYPVEFLRLFACFLTFASLICQPADGHISLPPSLPIYRLDTEGIELLLSFLRVRMCQNNGLHYIHTQTIVNDFPSLYLEHSYFPLSL